eukprot:1555064-Rhodomonas_salina.1
MPRMRIRLPGLAVLTTIDDLDDVTFFTRFRFRREHVRELLVEFDLVDANGDPKHLHVSNEGHLSWVSADTALLLTLRKLSESYPC